MLDSSRQEKIAWQVIKTLISRFDTFPEGSINNRNAPFHEAFLYAFSAILKGKVSDIPFLISLSSWLHGLSTTLGQSFFENVSHILSDGEKKSFTKGSGISLVVTSNQKDAVANIITNLKNRNCGPSLTEEDKLLQNASKSGEKVEASNFTADVFFENDTEIIAIELKSVKPNAGEMRGEKQKILEAKATLLFLYPDKEIKFFMGFPFDPTSDKSTSCNKERFLSSIIDGNKYIDSAEVLLANELWDFLSEEENTMQQILDLINMIATPEFMDIYTYLNESRNRTKNPDKYKGLLKNWFLLSELEIIKDYELHHEKLEGRTARLYWQDIFKDGLYKLDRYVKLKRLSPS